MNKYEQIKLVGQSDFTLNEFYLGYNYYWEIIEEIDENPSRLVIYEKEINILYDALNNHIKFRSNYKTDLKGLINV